MQTDANRAEALGLLQVTQALHHQKTPTLQFLPDSSISHQTQIGLGENKVIHFHSRCTAQGWGWDEAGGEVMKWEQQPVQGEHRKQHREMESQQKPHTKPKNINSKWDWEWIVFALNQSHQTTIPNWKPTQPEIVLVVLFHSKFHPKLKQQNVLKLHSHHHLPPHWKYSENTVSIKITQRGVTTATDL